MKQRIAIARLVTARDQIRLLSRRFTADNFNLETWLQPPNDKARQYRESYMVLLKTVSKNLDLKVDDPLRHAYPGVFLEARRLHDLCCSFDREHGVAGAEVPFDWQAVWDMVTSRVPSDLEPMLRHAITEQLAVLE
ncbi:hypothetical protein LOZ51_003340 [Ophidiomyces ophidiicola]|nr:hypothetical protein LOZ51_003340 [Ophidiomyces ophidiicola]KAI2004226.1 hypothetical protein LOZ49_005948 [Ophidiomyces ophidiicola]KAI2143310.1 hypothetical protein LOZ29_001068 [Ophidiomyces ophidiicola]KAI2146025.1 hypothetical protein LOZ28_000829 [Ophidiomyces ophidiicola]KAI2209888.1 hypothetical protein LOZ15_006148 [Ophidiomyces ophidiicola]